jgi:hypothetical protein
MSQNMTSDDSPRQGNTVKDPEEWKTGDEPMTGAQRSYLKTLSDEAHEPMEEGLTKAQAAKRIDELQQKTGRGHVTATGPNPQPDPSRDNTVKDPEEWKTGDEPMTGAQRSYLKTLSDEAQKPMEEGLTKAQAAKRIDELQQKTGRGRP